MSAVRLKRSVGGAFLAATAVVMCVGSLAWACVAAIAPPYVQTPREVRAPAGNQIVVAGGNWAASPVVEVVWESAQGLQAIGQVAPDAKGSFSTTVAVPAQASPGVYYLSAAQGDTRSEPVPFEVSAPGAAPSTSSGPPAASSEPAPAGGPTSRVATAGPGPVAAVAPAAAPSPEPAAVPAPGARSTGIATGVARTDDPAPSAPAGDPRPVTTMSPPVANAEAAAAPAATEAASEEPSTVGVPSRVNSADLRSGFAGGPSRVSPSLIDLPESSDGSSSPLPGAGVFASGALALLAGFGLAELNRRRALRTS